MGREEKGGSIVLFQVEASGANSLGPGNRRPLLGPQVEGSRDEVSKPCFLVSRIIISLFQITPDPAFAMAGEDPPLLEASAGKKLTRGTKRGRGGSGVGAFEHDLLAPEVIPDRSAGEDLRLPQVSSCWVFSPVSS